MLTNAYCLKMKHWRLCLSGKSVLLYGSEGMSLEKAIKHEWDTDDMTLFLLKVVGISG